MIVTEVLVRTQPYSTETWLDRQRISTPMSRFPEFAERRSSWRGPGADLVWVLLRTDDPDVFGVGQSRGGAVTAALIAEHLRALVVGRDPGEIGLRVAQLRAATQPYADGGIAAMGVSAVELALWDLHARRLDVPLTVALGGSVATPLRHYLTVPGGLLIDSLDAEMVATAEAVKVPAAWGPHDGVAGLDRLVADVEAVRAHVPADTPIAVDAFMSWDISFTLRAIERLHHLGIAWIEEPLPPRDFEGYAELRRSAQPVRIAGGEHLFSLADLRRFVEGCADIVQMDVTWCGGIGVSTAAARLAADAGLVVAPHAAGNQPWALHLAAALAPDVLVEVLLGVDGADLPAPSDASGVGITPQAAGFA